MPMPTTAVMPSISATLPLPSSTPSSSAWRPADRTSQRVPTISVSYSTTSPRTNGAARHAVAVEPGVEALGREHDAAVGVAERDGDGVAAAHHDALDERLAAVVEAGHGAQVVRGTDGSWSGPASAPVSRSALGGCMIGRERRRASGGHRGGLRRCCARASPACSRTPGRRWSRRSATGRRSWTRSSSTGRTCPSSTSGCRRPSATRACGPRSRRAGGCRARRSSCSASTSSAQYASELLADGAGGVGYLLKDRVADVREFMDALARVARRRDGARPRGRRPAHGQPPARRPARRAHARASARCSRRWPRAGRTSGSRRRS